MKRSVKNLIQTIIFILAVAIIATPYCSNLSAQKVQNAQNVSEPQAEISKQTPPDKPSDDSQKPNDSKSNNQTPPEKPYLFPHG